MKRILLFAVLLLPWVAHGQLEWRVSIKVFTGPGGVLPRIPYWELGGTNALQELANGVNQANAVFGPTGRGYRLRLLEIVTLPGTTAPLPAATNSWFNLSMTVANYADLDAKARANPVPFRYRDDAINIYYMDATNGIVGGYCTGPSAPWRIIAFAPNSASNSLAHEIGHFFSLPHTFENQQYQNPDGSMCPAQFCECAKLVAGDDDTPETAPDHSCWSSRSDIAVGVYNLPYFSLNSDQQWRVDNTWFNLMSYHNAGVRLTDDQMDFMTETSNESRFNVATGKTRFVDRSHGGVHNGTRANPYLTVNQGVQNATPGDIVLIRPGHYNEPGTYNKAITLRATRGEVTLGSP